MVRMDHVAEHDVTGLKRRRRTALEPSRRLGETIGGPHLSAFRVVAQAFGEVWCKRFSASPVISNLRSTMARVRASLMHEVAADTSL